ncbi:MAG: hypothetical protein R2824_29820 [Saprospiraceae bacterium]|nr:hypothetical protein [Lewinella sp.]
MAKTTINSITLSPDLTTLFLIDNGRAIPFNLKNKNGILIGMLDGQLSVASAPPVVVLPPDEPGDDQDPDNPGPVEDDPIKRLAEQTSTLKLPAKKAHWNFVFVEKRGVLSIIGALDIDISIIGALDIDISLTEPDQPDTGAARSTNDAADEVHKCRIYSFDISQQPINIRSNGKQLIIQY